MAVRIGLIGAGVMGAQHAAILARSVPDCELSAVADVDISRARIVADEFSIRHLHPDARTLVQDSEVDAVLIASSDETHYDHVLECVRLGKPVLCEKPLATSTTQCRSIISAEISRGKRLVQVGFMRRFDAGYREMKSAVVDREFGSPVLMHCIHRIATAPHYFTTQTIPLGSAVHEFDIARFLLGEELVRVQVHRARASVRAPSRNPLLFLAETESGVLVDIEVFVDAQYGYDVRAELVMEGGTISLPMPAATTVRAAGVNGQRLRPDWSTRFEAAYQKQNAEWVAAVRGDSAVGASAWDGYIATALAEASGKSLEDGHARDLELESVNLIYRQ